MCQLFPHVRLRLDCIMAQPHKPLSMLRSYTAADALTIGNAICGTVAIFLCLDYVATASARYLWIAFVLIPLALVMPYLPGAGLFGFVPLPGALMATVVVIAVLYVLATELQKRWFYRGAA